MNQELFPPALFEQPAATDGNRVQVVSTDSEIASGKDDETYLKSREKIIHVALRTTIAAARALHEIHAYKDGLLWKKNHHTFEDYCRVRWNYGKAHAYRLRECGGFINAVDSVGGSPLPLSEGQIRPLLQLPPENRVDCWRGITADLKPENLTARVISLEVGNFAAAQRIDIGRRRHQPGPSEQAVKLLEQLRKAVSGMEYSEDIYLLLTQVERLLGPFRMKMNCPDSPPAKSS